MATGQRLDDLDYCDLLDFAEHTIREHADEKGQKKVDQQLAKAAAAYDRRHRATASRAFDEATGMPVLVLPRLADDAVLDLHGTGGN